ncbi:Trypsin precursor [Vibrio thalassae]|uniref:Trypsin n=3 Tax=Vibrio thalassae TaxID=1243014 RepID=A0A240ERH3_9VIBR|nr:serine protease [Vibrio thalassae]SNX50890.1 Trypsin precursor [Vibrio thalassae]
MKHILLKLVLLAAIASPLMSQASSEPTPTPRIIGGTDTELGEYPFVAGIGKKSSPDDIFCTGTFIGGNKVLTAAHCVDGDTTADELKVVLGTNDKNEITKEHQYWVKRITIHPGYVHNSLSITNDIAVLETDRDIVTAEPIKLASHYEFSDSELWYENLTAIGWGFETVAPFYQPDILKQVDVSFIPDPECSIEENLSWDRNIANNMDNNILCTIRQDSQHNSDSGNICFGDSGGPLVVKNDNDEWVQIGVLSFMIEPSDAPCSAAMSGYTEVSKFRNWDPILEVDPPLNDNCVRFFKGANYYGSFKDFCLRDDGSEHNYKVIDSSFDDSFSSVKVGANVYVTHFENTGNGGWAWTQKEDNPAFNSGTDNTISSVTIFPRYIHPMCGRFWSRQGYEGQRWARCLIKSNGRSTAIILQEDLPPNVSIKSVQMGTAANAFAVGLGDTTGDEETFEDLFWYQHFDAGSNYWSTFYENAFINSENYINIILDPVNDGTYEYRMIEAVGLGMFEQAPEGAFFTIEVSSTNGEKQTIKVELKPGEHHSHIWPRVIARAIDYAEIDGVGVGVEHYADIPPPVGSTYPNFVFWEADKVRSVNITLVTAENLMRDADEDGITFLYDYSDVIHFSPIRLDETETNETFTGNKTFTGDEIIITILEINAAPEFIRIPISDYWKEAWRWPLAVAKRINELGRSGLAAGEKIGDHVVGAPLASGDENYLRYETHIFRDISINNADSCVTAYSEPDYNGESWSFCTTDKPWWDSSQDWVNNIRSYKVGDNVQAEFDTTDGKVFVESGTEEPSYNDYSNNGIFSVIVTPKENPRKVGPTCVRLWTKENFKGQPFDHCMTNGSYFHVNFAGLVENNNIESIEVGKRARAVLWNGWNGAVNRTFLPSHSYSGIGEFRNRAQSLDIYPAGNALEPTCVRLWTKENFDGQPFKHCMTNGYYFHVNFAGLVENNSIKSMEVGKDVKAVLWNGDKNRTFWPSQDNSGLGEFRNRAQALEIYPFTNALEPTCVRLWTKENFQGQPFKHCMTNGYYFHVNFAGLVENNSIKSMEVGKDVKAVLWNGDTAGTFVRNNPNLGQFSNRAQSMEIYPSF